MTGNIPLSDHQQEYNRILQNIKDLAKEKENATPQHIQERLKEQVIRAYDTLEMMKVPRRERVNKMLTDFRLDAGLIIPTSTVYYWLNTTEEIENQIPILEDGDSSLYTDPAREEENAQELQIADRGITMLNLWKSILRTKPWASLRDPKERAQSNALSNALLGLAIQFMDGRRLVPTATQAKLIECAMTYMPQDAYAHYLVEVKDTAKKLTAKEKIRGIRTIEEITGKQLGNILSLNIKDVDESLDPATPLEAKMKGFSGQKCPDCGSLRTNRKIEYEGRWYECAHCDKEFEGKMIPAYTRGVVLESDQFTHQHRQY